MLKMILTGTIFEIGIIPAVGFLRMAIYSDPLSHNYLSEYGNKLLRVSVSKKYRYRYKR